MGNIGHEYRFPMIRNSIRRHRDVTSVDTDFQYGTLSQYFEHKNWLNIDLSVFLTAFSSHLFLRDLSRYPTL